MKVTILLSLEDRIHDIDVKTNGDLKKFKVSEFESKVFQSLRKIAFGSSKQLEILNNIEIKVFGYARNNEEKKEVFKTGTL